MADVRSQALIEVHSPAGPADGTFQCPANCVTLVKSCYVYNADPAEHQPLLRVYTVNATFSVPIFNPGVPQGGLVAWEGWVAINPLEYVQLHLDGPNMFGWVSGAVLLGPPPFPPAPSLLPA